MYAAHWRFSFRRRRRALPQIELAEVDRRRVRERVGADETGETLLHELGIDEHAVRRAVHLAGFDHDPRRAERPPQERGRVVRVDDFDPGKLNGRADAVALDDDRRWSADGDHAHHRRCIQ
ncbi:MAG TPA: hypothetical protein VLU46_09920 [Thermoanaerobaculia bacterium]|nr:hypothetical protein [Thermoanaerobaculia bacterium]